MRVALVMAIMTIGTLFAGFCIVAYLAERQKRKIRNVIGFRHALEESMRRNPINGD